jgi:putative N6-adenine-specific DNA methylase
VSAPKMSDESAPKHSLYAVSAPGLEPLTAEELRSLGAGDVREHQGGVSFVGDDDMVVQANLWLRTASRVLKVVSRGRIRRFEQFVKLIQDVKWSQYLPADMAYTVKVQTSRSRLYHQGAIAQRIRSVLGERPETDAPKAAIWVRLQNDQCTVSLDSSGDLLHRRGYRQAIVKAPIRETLAAGILMAAGWDSSTPLVDPMCGSGTFVIEAAWMAQNRAPGLMRTFAFESWASISKSRVAELRAAAAAKTNESTPLTIMGSDRSHRPVRASRGNAKRAGVAIVLERGDALGLQCPPGPPGLLIANPPYGRRIQGGPNTQDVMKHLTQVFEGWRAVWLVPSNQPRPKDWAELLRVKNGGITVHVMCR